MTQENGGNSMSSGYYFIIKQPCEGGYNRTMAISATFRDRETLEEFISQEYLQRDDIIIERYYRNHSSRVERLNT